VAIIDKPWVTVLWLIPNAPDRDFFRKIIQRLARDRDAPVFEPHLTLGLAGKNLTSPALRLEAPIRLQPVGIFSSSVFTKTLFVRFERTPQLQALRESLGVVRDAYDPHLSLLYCKLAPSERARLTALLELPLVMIEFGGICAMRCPSPTQSRAEVESWQHLHLKKLRANFVEQIRSKDQ
jgi:hypothetical protein